LRVYCPDRPGYGLAATSTKRSVEHDPKSQVDFITMFADALCRDTFHIGGNSAGPMASCN
jgi:2-hydroxy-6-oxonona-2,4-dienedioate hydrolase